MKNVNKIQNGGVVGSVLVVGGGIAGIQAALDLANSGYYVYMVEQKSAIGGVMAQLDKTFPTNDCSMCIISPKLVECGRHLNIELMTLTEVKKVSGSVGNFKVTLKQSSRYVDLDKCTACGECAEVCPVEVPNFFDCSLRNRKPAFKLYPQGIPGAYVIEKRGVAPCKSACPANPSFQGCIALMSKGKYKEAFELFRQEHPMPGICGRVCNHPCEDACTRSRVDEPISIMALHRFLSDWAKREKVEFIPKINSSKSASVAIIGSGPAGLACAYFLAIEGLQVTVFEKDNVLGGMLSLGIPPYRLPRDIIEDEIGVLKKIGVTFKTETSIGHDVTIEELRQQNFRAFFLAIGAHKCKDLNVDGEELDGVFSGIDFLRNVNGGSKVDLGNNVAVIGGGNVALDVVRTALREGSENPFILYRRSENEMPANKEEIEECIEEGIKIRTMTSPVAIVGNNGKVSAVKCIKMRLGEMDESGRRRPEPIDGSDFIIKVDSVVSAIGQESDWSCLSSESVCELTEWGTIKVNLETFQSTEPDIFAGGDSVSGPATVIEAIAAGKKAARSIKQFVLEGKIDCDEFDHINSIEPEEIDVSLIPKAARENMPLSDPKVRKRLLNEEVQLGFTEEQVLREVGRCLSCGICSECYQCVDKCLAGAIDHAMLERFRDIEVGSIILSPGFTPFNPSEHKSYNYVNHPNIVTSLEFERILSASGPYSGHLVRPSDNRQPDKIAWLMCVGSRDINIADHGYCSAVCCMYASKQTLIAKEHSDKFLDTAVFFMDMRTCGKEFEKYYVRAEYEGGVRYIRSRVHTVEPAAGDNLLLRYVTEDGNTIEEVFDMVVLAVGLAPNDDIVNLASTVGIDLNDYSYALTRNLAPVSTSKEGVYVCGVFQEPKDIPQSVMEASAAASYAAEDLAEARGSLVKTRELPLEVDVSNQEARVGVFVCNCGINIGGIANVPSIKEYAETLPYVVYVEDNLFTCSQDTQDKMKEIIREKDINRVVVASCSPRTHESLFQETIREAGLNSYLFEMANIRDQNTWVHMNDPDKATVKAKDLVRMAIAKVIHVEPLHQVCLDVVQKVLVVGGGVAGMESALGVANSGLQVYLVERTEKLGGVAYKLRSTWQGEFVKPYLENLVNKVQNHPKIKLFLGTEVVGTSGVIGNFNSKLMTSSSSFTESEIQHGATVLATGGTEYVPSEYLYGKSPNVMTHFELDQAILAEDDRVYSDGSVVFIQCVGSRNTERPYCSKLCCTHTLKSALTLKSYNENLDVYVLYRDIRSYGFREKLYTEAREKGVIFMRYDPDENNPVIKEDINGCLNVTLKDHVLLKNVEINPNIIVLATAVIPNENKKLFELFKVPVNSDGFLIEAHAKLRPVDFSSEGMFMAGLAHYPKPLDETIAQAKASAARVMTVLSKSNIMVGGIIAQVDSDKCAVCLTCVRTCPYGIPLISDSGHAMIEPAECHGCGTCASECPGKAISLKHFTDDQLLAKAEALFKNA